MHLFSYSKSIANWNMFNFKNMIYYNFKFLHFLFFSRKRIKLTKTRYDSLLKHLNFFGLLTPVVCFVKHKGFFVNDKPSWIYPVKNNVTDVTRYAGQGFLSFFWNKSHEMFFSSLFMSKIHFRVLLTIWQTCSFISTILFKLTSRKSGAENY